MNHPQSWKHGSAPSGRVDGEAVPTEQEIAAWLKLTLAPGMRSATALALLRTFGLPEAVLGQPRPALAALVGDALARRLTDPPDDRLGAHIARTVAWVARPGQHFLTLADRRYPAPLLAIPDPPLLLYIKGSLDAFDLPAIAIVGSRHGSVQGRSLALNMAQCLSNAGLAVVSGLAQGIDAAAHRGALRGVGGTIAVLGTGADLVYPACHRELADAIGANGAMVSEWLPGTPPRREHFPRRNRVIAGLVRGVLVVEAAVHSGSLITARLAGEFGRDVFAVPGSIHSPLSKGCHRLLRDGAQLVESAADVLEALGMGSDKLRQAPPARVRRGPLRAAPPPGPPSGVNPRDGQTELPLPDPTAAPFPSGTRPPANLSDSQSGPTLSRPDARRAQPGLSDAARELLANVAYDPVTLDELAAQADCPSATLHAALLELELGGYICQIAGARYLRAPPP